MDGMDLKIARLRAKGPQWDLAREANVSPPRLSEMETNTRPVTQAVIDALERLKASKAG